MSYYHKLLLGIGISFYDKMINKVDESLIIIYDVKPYISSSLFAKKYSKNSVMKIS